MQSSKIIIVIALFLGIIFTGFECSSTELTSAKLYIQQKNYDKALWGTYMEKRGNMI